MSREDHDAKTKVQNLSTLKSNDIKAFLASFDTVICDCDGVLWRLDKAIPGSPETLNKFRQLGKKVYFITNNNIKLREYYVEKARKLGFVAEENEILSTISLTAEYLKTIGFNKTAYIIGSEGLAHELERVGIKHVGIGPEELQTSYPNILDIQLDKDIGAVIVGFDPYFSFIKLVRAASYLTDPTCLFIGTNSDERFPSESSKIVIPGTGCFVQAIQACSGRKPTIIDKNHDYVRKAIMINYQMNPRKTLMIGDRCNTDILLGTQCGFQTLLVLSGVTTLDEMTKIAKSQNSKDKQLVPDFYIAKLGDLLDLIDN
ncbi:glycerol-3-phosphate phosphatase-like [Chrysoperla carnea]|uniref:glycerol-3-phosphate phosphatase-like n=1 Tax=Chrysoperla carnea TaxID=189513 RepID=UPI001D08064C|nr:glycerol-3-phosphate phosphatase-like [Chrysoperla carnea]